MRIAVSYDKGQRDVVKSLVIDLAGLGHRADIWRAGNIWDHMLLGYDLLLVVLSSDYLGRAQWYADIHLARAAAVPIFAVMPPPGVSFPDELIGERWARYDSSDYSRAALQRELMVIAAATEGLGGADHAISSTGLLQPVPERADAPLSGPDAGQPPPGEVEGWYRWDGSRWAGASWTPPRTVFISYARPDAQVAAGVAADLRLANLEVWQDTALDAGADWWAEILARIRGAGVFVQALSDSSRSSEPCRLERAYADALAIPVVPVQVGAIASLRTWDVSRHQIVDVRAAEPEQRIRLVAAALGRLAERRPPQLPPVPEPDAPYAYLRGIRARLDLPDLDRRQQHDIYLDVRDRLSADPDTAARAELLEILQDLAARPDTVRIVTDDVEELLKRFG